MASENSKIRRAVEASLMLATPSGQAEARGRARADSLNAGAQE